MRNNLQIRGVKVELLRTGPSHNQLLSPLTQYLGICDGGEAGVVTVPFEHEAFLRRVRAMRDTGAATKERGPVLRDLGVEMAKILGAVPRLPGALNGDASGPDTLVHLRLVLSASELAILPFELAKVPIGPSTWGEAWLSLQARTPVVITRRTRDVSAARVRWQASPRLLFIASDPEADGIPFEAHRRALIEAVSPYMKLSRQGVRRSADGRREEYDDTLTILRNASFDDVLRECAQNQYTHVHILAHGGEDRNVDELSYGLVLHPEPGVDDVISGERFASAFTSVVDGAIHRPTVVTLATCDSANEGSVLIPGASMAHALHQAGIALVVASQFPLSMPGSDLLVNDLYPGLLRGDHPLLLLHRIRTDLHGRLSARAHDWASLVVYEALPVSLDEQLEEVRYRQGMRAVHLAFDQLDAAMNESDDQLPPERHHALAQRVKETAGALPTDGPFRLECIGLRAGSFKRLAEAEFWAGVASKDDTEWRRHMQACCTYLEDSLRDYEEASKGFLRNEAAKVRPLASLHWAMGQQLCMAAVLGQAVPDGTWEAARLSAEAYAEDGETDARAWAYATLAELWLLRLADPRLADPKDGADKQNLRLRREAEKQARHCATEMIKLVRSNKDAQVLATFAQIQRYVEWWSETAFERVVADRFGTRSAATRSWKKLGIVKLANQIIDILEMRGPGKRAALKTAELPVTPAGNADTQPATKAPAAQPGGGGTKPAAKMPAGATIVAAVAAHEKATAQGSQPFLAPAAHATGNGASIPAAPAFLATTSAARAAGGDTATFRIEMLPAGHGDCLWIEYGDGPETSRVLVDCGSKSTYDAVLRKRIGAQAKGDRAFELFILTHIDDDHIGGGIPLLKEAAGLGVEFGDVWFNGWRHLKQYGHLNARQGEIFSELTQTNAFSWNAWQRGGAIVLPEDGSLPTCELPGGLVLTLLSPSVEKLKDLAPKWQKEIEALGKKPGEGGFLGETARGTGSTDVAELAQTKFEPDAAENNGSSIAVLAEYEGKSVLLGADAHAPLLVASIGRLLKARGKDKLKLDAFKLPHHGSRSNLNKELLALLDCRNYLVSTNGSTFKHPDSEAIGRVIRFGGERPRLLFNYESTFSAIWKPAELQHKHGYEAVYPQEARAPGLIVPV